MNTDNESNDNTENMSDNDNTLNPIKESEFDRAVMETLGNKIRLTDADADAVTRPVPGNWRAVK